MSIELKSFNTWFVEEFGKDAFEGVFDQRTITAMRFAYTCSQAETLKYVMSNVTQKEENE